MSVNPYKSELQVARNLVALRWASIPVILIFCYYAFYYSFGSNLKERLEPIYIICCILAAFNIYLTLHISMLSRQLSVTKGLTTLKRAILRVLSRFFANVKTKGLRGLFSIPSILIKITSIIYLMFLETVKDFPVNPVSLENIMHLQIVFDLIVVLCLTRYTGSTESPMFMMASIPIFIAGSVISAKAGIGYAFLTCGIWVGNAILVKEGYMSHLKFIPPKYGDLHDCNIWIGAYSLLSIFVFISSSIMSQKLTLAFKEKVADLDNSLFISKSSSISLKHVALIQDNPWIVVDSNGIVINISGAESLHLVKEDLLNKNLLNCLPDLAKSNFEFTSQSVLNSRTMKKIPDVKIILKDNIEHIFDLLISYYREYDAKDRLMILFQEKTLEVNRKELVATLSAECMHARSTIDRLSKENQNLQISLDKFTKLSSDKTAEIEVLNTKVKNLDSENNVQNTKLSELMDNLASIKADNDQLRFELENRQMILEDISDFMNSCGELDELIGKVEQRTKDLFGLENSCFHVFDATDMNEQKNEILDIRKVSPRLLDIPRNHPETLDPALTEGRPVVFSAELRPEKPSAALAITNGDLKRLVAFVPLKENNQLLGMMMLEKYSVSDSAENIIDMVSFYLKQVSGAIKNAVENRKLQSQNKELHENLIKMNSSLDSVKTMIMSDFTKEPAPFSSMLFEISKLLPLQDAMLVRIQTDVSKIDCFSRIDKSKALELTKLETKMVEQLKQNYENKISFKSEDEVDDVILYPLVDKERLLGGIFFYLTEGEKDFDVSVADFCVNILSHEFSFFVLNEERGIWESFYCNNVPA